jgi:GT2 family glycosyltransferase
MSQKATIVITTCDRTKVLDRTLRAIFNQNSGVRVIVVDDFHEPTSQDVCSPYELDYVHAKRPLRFGKPWVSYRNPSRAINIGLRMVDTPITILQSDDTIPTKGSILKLMELHPKTINISTVIGCDVDMRPLREITGTTNRYVRFNLGSVHTKHLYGVGGCDEDFIYFGHEDAWLEKCLINGQGLTPIWRDDIVAHHVDHPSYQNDMELGITNLQLALLSSEASLGNIPWCSSSGPWVWGDM